MFLGIPLQIVPTPRLPWARHGLYRAKHLDLSKFSQNTVPIKRDLQNQIIWLSYSLKLILFVEKQTMNKVITKKKRELNAATNTKNKKPKFIVYMSTVNTRQDFFHFKKGFHGISE